MSDNLSRITGNESLKKYFNSEYIGAYSLDGTTEPIVTIDSIWFGLLTLNQGKKEEHILVKFKEKSVRGCDEVKPLVLNATNRKVLKKLYGDTAPELENKRIQLYIDPKVRDPQDGGFTEGLRIRPFVPKEREPLPRCTDCGGEIIPAMGKTAEYMAAYTGKHYGVPLCAECAQKRKATQAETETHGHEQPETTTTEEETPDGIEQQ